MFQELCDILLLPLALIIFAFIVLLRWRLLKKPDANEAENKTAPREEK